MMPQFKIVATRIFLIVRGSQLLQDIPQVFTTLYLLVPLHLEPLPGKVNQVEQLLLDPAQEVLEEGMARAGGP